MTKRALSGFDTIAFAAAIEEVIRGRGISRRTAATEAGVAASGLTRLLTYGRMLGFLPMVRISAWAGLPLDAYVRIAVTA